MMLNFSELEHLLGAYFHQDWDLDHSTADDVIKFYKQDATDESISALKQQLLYLIDSDNNDDELQALLFEKMGCSYYYPSEWKSSKEWLQNIVAVLNQS